MNPSQIPEKPLTASAGRVDNPEMTYFFEREDGSIIHVQEREAWTLYAGRNQTLGVRPPRLKLIGRSDGSMFRQALLESQQIMKTQGLVAAQERVRKGEQEELERARLTVVPPPNFDTVDSRGRPVNLNTLR